MQGAHTSQLEARRLGSEHGLGEVALGGGQITHPIGSAQQLERLTQEVFVAQSGGDLPR